MSTKKICSLTLLSVILCLGTTSCSSDDDDQNNGGGKEETTVTIGTKNAFPNGYLATK